MWSTRSGESKCEIPYTIGLQLYVIIEGNAVRTRRVYVSSVHVPKTRAEVEARWTTRGEARTDAAQPITGPPNQHGEDPGFYAVANTKQCTPDTTTSPSNNPPLPLLSAVSSAETRSADMLARSGVRAARAFGSARTQATKNATVRKIYPTIRPSSPDTRNQWQSSERRWSKLNGTYGS